MKILNNRQEAGTIPFDLFLMEENPVKEATYSAIVQALIEEIPDFFDFVRNALNKHTGNGIYLTDCGVAYTINEKITN